MSDAPFERTWRGSHLYVQGRDSYSWLLGGENGVNPFQILHRSLVGRVLLTIYLGTSGTSARSQRTPNGKVSISFVELAGVTSIQICEAATWSSLGTLDRYYRLKVVAKARSNFGRSVSSWPALHLGLPV